MKILLSLTAAALTMFASSVSAADVKDPRYFTVDENSIVTEEIPGAAASQKELLPAPAARPVTEVVMALDNIVNLVDKIWTLIEKNQPVVVITTNYANAVPFGMTHWSQLQGWSKPAVKKYSFSMKNGFGTEVVKVVYQLHYTHSGNYQGKGKYLTGVTIEPVSVTTAWGYTVKLVSQVPDSTVANVGTTADPIASMQVQLAWSVHTALKDITSKDIYYVQGDGLMQPISKSFDNGLALKSQQRLASVTAQFSDVKFN